MHLPLVSSTMRFIAILLFCCWNVCASAQITTLPEQNKKRVTQYFNKVINTQRLDRFKEFFADSYIWHQMNGIDIRSNPDSAHLEAIKFVFRAIPDIHYTIDNILADDDMVALNCTITGTANSEFFGLPAALKKVRFKQMFFFRLLNNKITEEWELVDLDGLRAQMSKQ